MTIKVLNISLLMMMVSHITINNYGFDIFPTIVSDIIVKNDGKYVNNNILTTVIVNDYMHKACITLNFK